MTRVLGDPLQAPGVALSSSRLMGLRRLALGTARSAAATGVPGGVASPRRGRGLEMLDLRAFQEGDDPRHVDRNATARTGRVHVRNFHDEHERAALLIADFRPQMLWGTRRCLRSVAAAEALALTGWRMIAAGGRIGLLAIGDFPTAHVPLRAGERAIGAVTGALASAHGQALRAPRPEGWPETEGPPLDALIDGALALAPRRGRIWLATGLDRPGPDFDGLARRLSRRGRLGVLLIADAFETAPPRGSYPVRAARNGVAWLRVGRRGPRSCPDRREARLRALGIAHARVDAGASLEAMARAIDRLDAAPV